MTWNAFPFGTKMSEVCRRSFLHHTWLIWFQAPVLLTCWVSDQLKLPWAQFFLTCLTFICRSSLVCADGGVAGYWFLHSRIPMEQGCKGCSLRPKGPKARVRILGKGKEEYLYSAFLHQGTYKVLRYGSHSFTCKQHHACLSFVSIHQMAPPQELQTSSCSLLLIYRLRKDERLSWPGKGAVSSLHTS